MTNPNTTATDTQEAQDILNAMDGGTYPIVCIKLIDDYAVLCGLKGYALDEIRFAIHRSITTQKPIKINTTRIKHMYNEYTRKLVIKFFQICPYFKMLEYAKPGVQCNIREIDFELLEKDSKNREQSSCHIEIDNPCGRLRGVPRGLYGGFYKNRTSEGFLKWRVEKWKEVCESLDTWKNKLEFEFEGKEKFEEFFASLKLDPSVVYSIADTPEELEKLQDQFSRLLDAKKDYDCFKLNGRVYDPLTNISKKLRRALRIWHNGRLERIVEVDLHATYMYLLLGQMEQDSEEIKREIAEISKYLSIGKWYEFVYSLLPPDVARRIKCIKEQFQKQVMFPANRPFSSCPVYHALLKRFPIVFGRIREKQLKLGYTDFSHYLTESEGTLFIDSVLKKLKETLNAPCRTLHDAIMVPVSLAEEVRELLIQCGQRLFGIIPGVGVK